MLLGGFFMNGYKKLGEKIKFYREQRNFSGEDFAKLAGITFSRLEQIENGKVKYKFETLEKLANVLEIDLPELLDFDS